MRKEIFYNPFCLLERIGRWAETSRRLFRFRGSPASGLNQYHIESAELLDQLKKNPPKIIYDIGANRGTWTLLAKTLFPCSEIHGFEPLEEMCKKFNENTKALSKIFCHRIALGGSKTIKKIEVNSEIDTSSLLKLTSAGKKQWKLSPLEKRKTEVWPLDLYIKKHHLKWPNLIKLDVQGYELECLKGAIKCLDHKPAIICELSFKSFYNKQPLFSELVAFLGKHKYELASLGVGTSLGQRLLQADGLFLPS